MNKFTEHLEKVGNKYRIRENFQVSPINTINKKESVIIEGKEISTHKHYVFRIWDKNFNANGRNYCNVIDEIIKNNYTTVGLADHPENDGSVKDICFVEKNPRMIDGWMCVDAYPVGEHGRTIEEILDVGGPIEVSSSVLGDIDDNGYVFGVTLERYMDNVLQASNRQLHYTDHIEQREDEGQINNVSEEGCVNESLTILDNKSSSTLKEHTDNDVEEKGDKNMVDIAEVNLKLNLRSMLKEADNTSDLYAKKEILESAHLYAKSLPTEEMANEIAEKINTTDAEIKVLSEKGLKTDELNESVKSLTEEKAKLEEEVKSLKEESKLIERQLESISTLYEDKQWKASEEELLKNRRLAKEVCSLKIKNRKLESEIETLKIKNKRLSEKALRFEAEANSKVDASEMLEANEKLSISESHNTELVNRIHTLRKEVLSESKKPSVNRFAMARAKFAEKKVEPKVESKSNVEFDKEDATMDKLLNHKY